MQRHWSPCQIWQANDRVSHDKPWLLHASKDAAESSPVTSLAELLRDTHEILVDTQAPHALIGGFAMAALGFPRVTNDVDDLVHGDSRQATAVAFQEAGFEVFRSSEETL